jgi:hypothetical protein
MNKLKSTLLSKNSPLSIASLASSRFQKGQSGNPNGRPKKRLPSLMPQSEAPLAASPAAKSNELDTLLLKDARRTVTLRENGEPLDITVAEGIIRSLSLLALKGNLKAQLAHTTLLQQAEAREKQSKQCPIDISVRYRLIYFAGQQMLKENKITLPIFFPHPDDIPLTNNNTDFHINGPFTQQDAIEWEKAATTLTAHKEHHERVSNEIRRLKRSRVENKHQIIEAYEQKLIYLDATIQFFTHIYPNETVRRQQGFNLREYRIAFLSSPQTISLLQSAENNPAFTNEAKNCATQNLKAIGELRKSDPEWASR